MKLNANFRSEPCGVPIDAHIILFDFKGAKNQLMKEKKKTKFKYQI